MSTDAELLQRYTREKSEAAFAELVQRHLPLVYSAAVRQTGGDAHLAQDVAQTVFTALAHKAATLTERATLAGWLYLGTHHAAAQAVRTNRRREAREQEAHAMHELLAPATSAADWDRVRPVLDEAMRELSEPDREAVLLRYFEQRPFADIGAALNLSEDAARMRVERALDKLHALLGRRGITSTTAALAVVLQGHVIAAVPAGLASSITGGALAAASGAVAAGGFFTAMSSPFLPTAIATVAAAVSVGAAFMNLREQRTAERTLAEITAQRTAVAAQVRELQARREEAKREAEAAAIVPAAPSRAAAPSAPPRRTGPDPAAVQAGKDFLAAHPEAQRLIQAALRNIGNSSRAIALRNLGVSEEERSRVEAEMARTTSATLTLRDLVFRIEPESGTPGPRRDGVAEILGDARYLQLQQEEGALEARSVMRTLANATVMSDAPLLPAQVTQLNQLIATHQRVRQTGSNFALHAPEWETITQRAAEVLSPPQLALFKTVVGREGRATVPMPTGAR